MGAEQINAHPSSSAVSVAWIINFLLTFRARDSKHSYRLLFLPGIGGGKAKDHPWIQRGKLCHRFEIILGFLYVEIAKIAVT